MKRFLTSAMIFVIPALMIACAKSSEDKSASTPLNNAIYNQYQQFGFSAYPTAGYGTGYGAYNGSYYSGYGYNAYNPYTSGGSCSCGSASIPVYNASFGMGCLQQQQVSQVYTMIGWVFPTMGANGQVTSLPQYSNIPSTSSCQAAQSCMLNGTGTPCAAGYTCRAAQGSNMGVCLGASNGYYGY